MINTAAMAMFFVGANELTRGDMTRGAICIATGAGLEWFKYQIAATYHLAQINDTLEALPPCPELPSNTPQSADDKQT